MTDVLPEELRGKTVADLPTDGRTPDELRGLTPDEMQHWLDVADAWLRSIHQTDEGELRDKSDGEQAAFDYLLKLRDTAIAKLEENRAIQEVFRKRPKAVETAMFVASHRDDPFADVRRMSVGEARDKALRVLDDREASAHMTAPQKDQVAKQLRLNSGIARRILVTENEDYRTAWMKMVTNPHPILTQEETRAMLAWDEYRAMADFTNSAGGFGIPVFIDPSIILTAQESSNPFLSIARQVDINTTVWKGVSSAGVTWAFQTEGAVTTDNAPVLAQPTVSVHMARGFIPFSIEVQSDYPGFASGMAELLAQGYNELLVNKFTIGSGTGEPRGVLTAISATAGDRVKVVTGGSIGAPDPYNVWKALPQKYRASGRASWLMSVGVNNAIRQVGAANVYHGYTVNLPEKWADQLFNAPVYESAYMPDTTTFTTTAEGQALVGDFSNFVIARNGGMNVELVPTLFQQQTAATGVGFPTGQRGWFAYARIGSDVVNTSGFRLLVANT